ncbi:MAG TPA: MBOAT family O-acyltransferase, partial [Bacteroidia bacterium]|nr:MBOAT family O-acyltransferase [Bacteroidia bacterium]
FLGILGLGKMVLPPSRYVYVLMILNALFLVFIYPKPWHFLVLIVYSYLATLLAIKVFRFKKKISGIILLLLPMLLVKADIRFEFYPFELNNWLSFAGLSYASFRIMSYYMDQAPGQDIANPVSYFNYLAFTPTLLIGPIDRYAHFNAAAEQGFTKMTSDRFIGGWNKLVKGIVFKFILAEVVDRYWLQTHPAESKQFLHMASDMYAYYVYLFFDFAGYSSMAIGVAEMMGMEVPVNFTNPFAAVNPQDFWRKFHITLGDWLRDYFFTPLYTFFTRRKRLKAYPLLRQNTALILTFLLMGCWNGFKFNFMLSGLIFGLYSAIHNTYTVYCRKKNRDIVFGTLNPTAVKYLSIFIMFNLAAFALYIFSGRCPLL